MAKKKPTNTQSPFFNYILPSENNELKTFSQKFKVDMMEQIVSSIELAITNQLPFVEVFQFKNSDFVITLSEKDFLVNLDNIYQYYMNNEVYEFCSRVIKLQKTLKENTTYTDEKPKR